MLKRVSTSTLVLVSSGKVLRVLQEHYKGSQKGNNPRYNYTRMIISNITLLGSNKTLKESQSSGGLLRQRK